MRRWWRERGGTIRTRVLGGLAVLFVLVLTASTVATLHLLNRYVYSRASETVRVDASRIAALVASGPQTVDSEQVETLLGPPLGIVGVQAGDVRFSTGSAEGRELKLLGLTERLPYGEVVAGPDDVTAVRIRTPGLTVVSSDWDDPVPVDEIVLANDGNVDAGTLAELFARIVAVAGVALVALLVLGATVLRVGLGPLTRMARAADAIADGSLGERLPVQEDGSETDALAGAVNRAFDAQARAEARVRAFAADASHELRTPLATISGWLELHRQGALPAAEVDQALDRIETEVGRMRLLVEELGLLARLDTGRPLDLAPVDLTDLAESVVADARVIYPALDIALEVEAGADARVEGDEARLAQVLRNLVGNAVQHTPAGTSVRLRLATTPDRVRLSVSDDGQGMAADDLPRLFDRFWRAEASRSRAFGGSGLGLAIVQAIVQAHGGVVAAESAPGVGTVIHVDLPLT